MNELANPARITVNSIAISVPRSGITAIVLMAFAGIDGGGRVLIRSSAGGGFGERYNPDDIVPVADGDDFTASPSGHF